MAAGRKTKGAHFLGVGGLGRIFFGLSLASSCLAGLTSLPSASAGTALHGANVTALSCPTAPGAPMPHPVATAGLSVGGCAGYLVVGRNGRVSAFGAASFHGDMAGQHLNAPMIGITASPDGGGYWLLAADGGIFTFGDAMFHGSMGGQPLNQPIDGMAGTPDGGGYWLLARDGGVFAFGTATYAGSMGGRPLNQPMVGIASNPDGSGYWLVAGDGGIFAFNSQFHGSMGGQYLNQPVIGMSRSADGGGYFLVARDGGVFTFGDAPFEDSLGGSPPATGIVGLSTSPSSQGYYAMDALGNVYAFGDAQPLGSAACPPNDPGTFGVDPNLMANDGGGAQLVTVVDPDYSSKSGTLTAWDQLPGGCWTAHGFPGQPAQPYRAETGYAGLKDHRREGDGSTPTGIWGFGTTMYGVSLNAPNSSFAYHHLVPGDYWVENPASQFYNTFQHSSSTNCASNPFGGDTECLWQQTQAYDHFAEILFNPPPTHDPVGAGIFLHDYTASGTTAGCIALPPGELDAVLAWLIPSAQPHIAVGTAAEINAL